MLVLLPPSETKAIGGAGAPLDHTALTCPDLNPVREKIAHALVELAADVPGSLAALALSERQADEVARNAQLRHSPTMPALSRYTGVLYDALDVPTLKKGERDRAHHRLAIASALFGVVRGGDPIPAYRLSGGSALPSIGPLGALWRPALEPALAAIDDFVVDLRSGPYATLARIPHAVTIRVVSEDGAGVRKAISHFNKAHKGLLARALSTSRAEPKNLNGLIKVAAAAGLRVEKTGDRTADLFAG
ncbi:peroxide stress protein YaaA [Umezawaea endophytica]|uniref:Peroxide stress protein YaaA n=1 Tax=Umezawaea endophytica TaxID=1654476 RepID=A0A9X3AKC8_9PSEU|nr:peroxide stress protein YaaA [Umezawaea endophytica]MCS7482685.1 peroxide stress protein YaaA [Umezawaea endophytica]